eukprot:345304-Amphidinium_carterae.1
MWRGEQLSGDALVNKLRHVLHLSSPQDLRSTQCTQAASCNWNSTPCPHQLGCVVVSYEVQQLVRRESRRAALEQWLESVLSASSAAPNSVRLHKLFPCQICEREMPCLHVSVGICSCKPGNNPARGICASLWSTIGRLSQQVGVYAAHSAAL